MKRLRLPFLVLVALLLPGCEPKSPASGTELAAPVTAPAKAREHLRQQVRKINVQGQRRRRDLEALDQNR